MGKHSLLLVSTKQCVMAVFLIDMTQCCGEESEAAEAWAGFLTWRPGAASAGPGGCNAPAPS